MSVESVTSPQSIRGREPSGSATADSSGHEAHDHRELEGFLREVDPQREDRPLSLRAWMDLAEAWKITRALSDCRGNRSAAARSLGIGRRTLYAKMEKLRISPTWRLDSSDR